MSADAPSLSDPLGFGTAKMTPSAPVSGSTRPVTAIGRTSGRREVRAGEMNEAC